MQPSTTKGTVEFCPDCKRKTSHETAPGGWPTCVRCGYIQRPKGGK
jgi:ribosomal protein L37AE/L43A